MIRIENLGFSYGEAGRTKSTSSKYVLKNLDLTLEEGRIYGLLGENGVGKTTLLTLLCGLKKPQTGSIEVSCSTCSTAKSVAGAEARTTAGTTPTGAEGATGAGAAKGERPYERKPSLLTEQYYLSDEVAAVNMKATDYARNYGKFWEKFDIDKFHEILQILEVEKDQNMSRMSFGQLKKTYIAFALACNTKYLFMDEPTNGLDIPSKAQFRKAVMKYTSEDATIVISTHQVRDLENIIDPIIILDRDGVLLNASLEVISQKLYFDYTNEKAEGALYSEMIPGGNIQVLQNTEEKESKVNIEALFNTVHVHKSLVREIFSK